MNREEVLEYIRTQAMPSDLLQILDALVDPITSYIGSAAGIEDDRHNVLMQIQADEAGGCKCGKCDNCVAARSDEHYDRKRDGGGS